MHASCRLNNSFRRRSIGKFHFYFIEGSSGVTHLTRMRVIIAFFVRDCRGWSVEIFYSFELTSMLECPTEDTDHYEFSQQPIWLGGHLFFWFATCHSSCFCLHTRVKLGINPMRLPQSPQWLCCLCEVCKFQPSGNSQLTILTMNHITPLTIIRKHLRFI